MRRLPTALLSALGLGIPALRELARSAYQFEQLFVMDSCAFTATLGMTATPWDISCAATMRGFESRVSSAPVA